MSLWRHEPDHVRRLRPSRSRGRRRTRRRSHPPRRRTTREARSIRPPDWPSSTRSPTRPTPSVPTWRPGRSSCGCPDPSPSSTSRSRTRVAPRNRPCCCASPMNRRSRTRSTSRTNRWPGSACGIPASVKARVDRDGRPGADLHQRVAVARRDGCPRRPATRSEGWPAPPEPPGPPIFGVHGPFGPHGVFGSHGPFGPGGVFGPPEPPDRPEHRRPRGRVQGWVR